MRALLRAAGELPSPAARARAGGGRARTRRATAGDGWLQVGEARCPQAALRRFRAGAGSAPLGASRRSTISGSRSNGCIDLVEAKADPNDWRLVTENAVGVRYTPLATRSHARMGTRERVLETAQRYPDRLERRARCARHPGAVRRAQPRDRRRIPEGRAALPRAWPAGDSATASRARRRPRARSSSAAAPSTRRSC